MTALDWLLVAVVVLGVSFGASVLVGTAIHRMGGEPVSRIPEPATKETLEFFASRPCEDGGCWCEDCNTVDADEAVIDLRPEVEAAIAELFDSDPDVRRRRARVFPDGVIR